MIILALAVVCNATAQSVQQDKAYHPYSPATLPANAPQWMEKLNDLETVNYHEMVDSFETYLYHHPEARRKTPRTKPIVNHFRRWQKSYLPYVQADGRIVLPDHASFREYVAELNRASSVGTRAGTAPTTEGWEVVGPIQTYNWQTKKLRVWQANVQRLCASKTHPETIYCGTETGMIFKSTDKGAKWSPCTGSYYFGGEISSVEVSPTNPDKVLVGAGTFVWLTTDGGASWKDITPQSVRTYNVRVRDAVFHPSDDNQMLVGNDKGLYKTTDNGANWTQINSGMCFDVKYKPGHANCIYVLIQKKGTVQLEISTDAGGAFALSSFGINDALACGRIGVSAAPNGSEYIYVIACKADQISSYNPIFYSGTPVLFKSTDGGTSWNVNEDIGAKMESPDKGGGQGYYDMVITASNKDPEKLLFGIIQLYASSDGGKTIKNKGGYYGQFDLHCDMQDIQVSGNDTWLSTDGGVIYSSDFFDTHADPRINGIYASEFWGFDQGWNEDVMVGGRNHNGNIAQMSRYNGVTLSMGGSEIATGYVFLSNPRKVAYSDGENVTLPDNWTEPFVPFLTFWHYPYESTQYGLGFEFDPRYAKSFLVIQGTWEGDHHVLWKTVDDGNSFVELHKFSTPITSHAISRSNPDKIVVMTGASLYASLDGGNTFEAYQNLPQEVVNALHAKAVIHPKDENEIWVTTGEPGGMFRTTDNGKTWEKMDKNLIHPEKKEKYIINRFFLTGNEKDAVYAIGAVWRSLNNGYTTLRGRVLYWDKTTDGWQDYSQGLPPVLSINRMLPFYKEGKIRIATNNGIWQRDLVDARFKPIAQPLVLNMGKKDERKTELHLDSYSIVNQKDATWKWSFQPEPLSVSDPNVRNPVVQLANDQSYDVTLTVTTPQGTDSKTVKRMIWGNKEVPSGIVGQEKLQHDVLLSANRVPLGTDIVLSSHSISEACVWKLFDAAGRNVQTQKIPTTGTMHISTQGLTEGVYFYTITNATFKKTGKLVVTRK